MADLAAYYRNHGIDPRKSGAMPDDFIDFSCSPVWQGYYYERGLTPWEGHERRGPELETHMQALQQEILRLRQAIERRQIRQEPALISASLRRHGRAPPPDPQVTRVPTTIQGIEV